MAVCGPQTALADHPDWSAAASSAARARGTCPCRWPAGAALVFHRPRQGG